MPPQSMPSPMQGDQAYELVDSPSNVSTAQKPESAETLKPRWIMYSSTIVCLLQTIQSGWMNSQLNYTAYNDADDCDARPIPNGRCIMFPGHSTLEWTFAVNAWLVGAFIGSIAVGKFALRYGLKNSLYANSIIMAVGAILQATSFNVWQFTVGRFVAGLATGISAGVTSTYLGEIAPPRLRSTVGITYQLTSNAGGFVVTVLFFAADNTNGWRYIAAVPAVLALLFLALAPRFMVRSPARLLLHERYDEAEEELSRLFGAENVPTALAWIESQQAKKAKASEPTETSDTAKPKKRLSVLAPEYRAQFFTAMALVVGRQLTGIQAVTFFSSDLFRDAGLKDDRIGTSITKFAALPPIIAAGYFSLQYGNRKMVLAGAAGIALSAVGMTVSLIIDSSVLSIVFTTAYVFAFGLGLAPFVWIIASDIFPDAIRTQGMAIVMANQRLSNLVVSISYPYIAAAIGDYRYLPFVACTVLTFVFILKRVPETGNRTHAEVQEYFKKKQ